jgi:hypothetical protein
VLPDPIRIRKNVTINPSDLQADLDLLERIEKATLRLVVQALYDFREGIREVFTLERRESEADAVDYIGEDITREALDRLGTSIIPIRLAGNIDYKKARYVFQPDFAIGQALFVDSKVEEVAGARTATIQTAQTSMTIRQVRAGRIIDQLGGLPVAIQRPERSLLSTTIFVKYNYQQEPLELMSVSILCLPNGMLQGRYNPTAQDTFWLVGRNAPTRDEPFRVRISLPRLKAKAGWRVQHIDMARFTVYVWDE